MPRLGWEELLTILRRHQIPRGVDGHAGQVRAVGTHVSDMAVLVQALSHLHGPPRGEAELAVGFLLQRAGGERRIRLGCVRLVFQRRRGLALAASRSSKIAGLRLVQ